MAIVTTMAEPPSSKVYSIAIVIPTFCLLIMILILPALIQHYRNRNIGATALVAGVMVALFNDFLNAIIWPNDHMEKWYNGVGLCDIQVKVIILQNVLFPAAVCCILRALAKVLNTDSQSWIQTTAQERRALAIDLACVVVAPSLQMLFHYIVQPNRYYVYGVAGCTPSTDLSWLALVLIFLPPLMWSVVDVFYAMLILVRLVRYRLTFNAILANSNTTKSRFLRLYILCCITTLGMLPMEILTLYMNVAQGLVYSYSWSTTHPTDGSWDSAIFVRSDGEVFYDRILWICGGAVVFFLFGFGRDAMKMYKEVMLKLGLGRFFPRFLRLDSTRRGSVAATISTIGSKARLWLKKRETWTTSTASVTDSTISTPSPKKTTFSDGHSPCQGQHFFSKVFKKHNEKVSLPMVARDDPFILASVGAAKTGYVQSTVTAEPISPTTVRDWHKKTNSSGEVLVMKEVRQASETAETLPKVVYEGV